MVLDAEEWCRQYLQTSRNKDNSRESQGTVGLRSAGNIMLPYLLRMLTRQNKVIEKLK